jgi:hypothetical protein
LERFFKSTIKIQQSYIVNSFPKLPRSEDAWEWQMRGEGFSGDRFMAREFF